MNSKRNSIAICTALLFGALGTVSGAQAAAHHTYTNGRSAYGYVDERAPAGGQFVNGDFIPRGTSSAQVPSHHEEDNYGSEAGKD